ncbi:MAG: gamma-glutamyl-gamma-aminobutyrate hydrolase family protein [Terriglobales bacterium]
MPAAPARPRWYLVPARILLVTFLLTLLAFAVSLLLGIIGMVVLAGLRGVHPNMTLAYRHFALPAAASVAAVAFIAASVMEIRNYRQAKALAGIARASRRETAEPYNGILRPRIAIPVPHSGDQAYAERSLPQYEHAVEVAGGEPVRIPLHRPPAEVMKLIEGCDAVLLPGSKADIDPAKYKAPRDPRTAAVDVGRDAVDELLLRNAYDLRKPVLGICYGLQALNVYRAGTLVQHIESAINHAIGKKAVAHAVAVDPNSMLAAIVHSGASAQLAKSGVGHGFSHAESAKVIPVNSSHHQSAEVIGDGLRAVARCPDDGIIEAVEGTSPDHFVLAVQWHPERTVDDDEPSRAIFRALVEAAREHHRQLDGTFEPA